MKQFLYIVVLIAFLVIACTPEPPWIEELNLPILSLDTSAIRNFQCKTYCSEKKLRTGMALLTWSTDEGLIGKQRVDVTVYKKGFETKMYTILWPLKKSQTFQTSRLVKLPDRPDKQILYLDVNQVNIDKQEGLISIELEGLQAGLNYFWRILTLTKKGWVPGSTINCQGPVCPADVEETHIVR